MENSLLNKAINQFKVSQDLIVFKNSDYSRGYTCALGDCINFLSKMIPEESKLLKENEEILKCLKAIVKHCDNLSVYGDDAEKIIKTSTSSKGH